MAGDRGVAGAVSRRELFRRAGGAGLLLVLPGAARAARLPPAAGVREDGVVLRWNAAALEGVRSSRLGPPMVARALAIVHTSAYDAWAAHDRIAVGTRLGGALRVPPWKRTFANKNEAVSFAAYRAAVDLFPGSKGSVFDPLMAAGSSPVDLRVRRTCISAEQVERPPL